MVNYGGKTWVPATSPGTGCVGQPGNEEAGYYEFMPSPTKPLPRIVSVVPAAKPLTLRIRWDNGSQSLVNVSGPVNTYRFYAPLREQEPLFRRVQVGEYGADIVWPDGIDMSADTLWRLAQEQAKLKGYLLNAGYAGDEPNAFEAAMRDVRAKLPPLAPRKVRLKS
jgi:hypothetical protein